MIRSLTSWLGSSCWCGRGSRSCSTTRSSCCARLRRGTCETEWVTSVAFCDTSSSRFFFPLCGYVRVHVGTSSSSIAQFFASLPGVVVVPPGAVVVPPGTVVAGTRKETGVSLSALLFLLPLFSSLLSPPLCGYLSWLRTVLWMSSRRG